MHSLDFNPNYFFLLHSLGLIEKEIEVLVGQLLGFHMISSKVDIKFVDKVYDYTDDEYTVGIEGINDFDLNIFDKPKEYYKEIYNLHQKTKDRIKDLAVSLKLYKAMAGLLDDYNDSLEYDRELINKEIK